MKKAIAILILYFFIILIPNNKLYSQSSSPLYVVEHIPNIHFLGFYIGLGQNFQAGKIYPECIDCSFEKGNKFGFTTGALYEYRLSSLFFLGSAIEYNYLGINAFFSEIEAVPIEIPINNDSYYTEIANIRFQHEANVNIHQLSLIPYLKFKPFDFVFLRLGIGLGYNISNTFTHQKTLDQNSYTLSNGEIISLRVPNSDKNTIIEDGKIAQENPFQIYLNTAIGFNLNLSDKLTFSPIFSYSNAFTNISDKGDNPKIHNWRILLELRYDISKDPNF